MSSMMVSSSTSLLTSSISFSLTIANEPPKTPSNSSYFALCFKNTNFHSSPIQFQSTHFNFPSYLPQRCNILSVYAQKKTPIDASTALMEITDFDDDDDDELEAFDDDFHDDEDDDDDGEVFLPFRQMRKWMENKPRGFGEGKVYDTSIEDKLLEEMQQSRKAQAANLDNLKRNPVKSAPKKASQIIKGQEDKPSGVRVRVINLPKKKNIHRDLQSAFSDVHGVVNIVPSVSGNKKTKDPICKGFAFVDFKSEDDADRFVQQFSGQNVVFGRVTKQIKCTMVTSQSLNSSEDGPPSSFSSGSSSTVSVLEEDVNADFDLGDSSSEETSSDVPDDSDELGTTNVKLSTSELDDNVSAEPMKRQITVSEKKNGKNRTIKKSGTLKGKAEKVSNLEIPGSAKRLKIREKAVLGDVFNKYGSNSALASAEES